LCNARPLYLARGTQWTNRREKIARRTTGLRSRQASRGTIAGEGKRYLPTTARPMANATRIVEGIAHDTPSLSGALRWGRRRSFVAHGRPWTAIENYPELTTYGKAARSVCYDGTAQS